MQKTALILSILLGITFLILGYQLLKPKPALNPDQIPLDINLIKDLNLNNLIIEGRTYHFNLGKVTDEQNQSVGKAIEQKVNQLAFFYIITKEDPLFTSPDFNSEDFEKSIKLLEKEEEKYKEISKRPDPFFPIPFLKTISPVIEQEKLFFSNPSFGQAQSLLNAYINTSEAYENEAVKFANNIKEHTKQIKPTNSVFVTFDVSTDQTIFLSDLDKLVKNANALKTEVQARKQCLIEGVNCQRTALLAKEPEIKIIPRNKPTLLPFSALFPLLDSSLYKEIKGPFLMHSPCWGWGENFTSPSQPIYILMNNSKLFRAFPDNIDKSLRFKLGNQNFYRVIGPGSPGDEFAKLGLKRTPQPETNSYMCINLEYQPKTATLERFLNQFKNDYLFTKFKDKEIPDGYLSFWQQAKTLENDFLNTKLPSDEDMDQLSSAYLYAYKISGKGEFLQRYLILNRQLSNFPLILNSAAAGFLFVLTPENTDPKTFENETIVYNFIYPFRSLWNLLYFPFSPSFWRIDQKPDYLKKVNITNNAPVESKIYITYEEASKLYSPQEIQKWHELYQEYEKAVSSKLSF